MAGNGVTGPRVRSVTAALGRHVRAADPLWMTRWLVLLVLLLDSLRYGVHRGEAPVQVLGGVGVIALAVVANLALRAAQQRAGALAAWAYAALLWSTTWAYAATVLATTPTPERLVYPVIGTAIVAVATALLAERVRGQQRLLAEALESRDRELAWRRALIDMLAHDLRAPMATAATSADLPREQIAVLSDAGRRQIRRALRLLDDPFVTGGQDGSTGLGLWISHLLVGAMGGEIAHRRDGGRTRFTVRLPAAPHPPEGEER